MASIWQVTWRWTGFTGAPGFTNLFYESTAGTGTEALAAVTKSRLLFNGVTGTLNSNTHIDPVTDVKLLDDASGDLLNIFTVTGVTGVTGANGGTYVGPAGGVIDWLTTTVNRGKRVQGRTFVVPMSSSVFDNDGTITGTNVTALATAAEAMRTASGPTFGVWSRPIDGAGGLWGPAISSRVPDLAAVLRSRRD